MNIMRALLFLLLLVAGMPVRSQTASPTMTYTTPDGQEETADSYDGSAPLKASFKANAENVGDYTPLYEWRFTRENESSPFLVRYDEDTDYDFVQTGSFQIELRISFVQGNDTILYEMDQPFAVNISESKLEVPNAFTPNGDGVNDVFRVKEGYQSIVEFKAMVFDRWGKKLYEWTDIDGGWDGRANGRAVPDGGYYLNLQARGADGKKYNIKKVINVLHAYTESSSAQ